MGIPQKISSFAAYSTNFNDRIVASASTFGLTTAQATQYTALHDPFISLYNAAAVPGARSPSLTIARDAALASLLPYARELYGFVQANAAVADANKLLLNVTVRAVPRPTPRRFSHRRWT